VSEPETPAIPVALRDLLDESPRLAREVEPAAETPVSPPATPAPSAPLQAPTGREPPEPSMGPPAWLTEKVTAILGRYSR
jgi:hypothetical protein